MVIDMASVFAERYKDNPQMLQSAVLGQGGDPSLDAYTALRALQLLKESQRMQAAMAAQGPTQSPSLVDQALQPEMPPQIMAAQPQPQPQPQPQGLAGMPSNMPEEEQGFAPGGIVSFAKGGQGALNSLQAGFFAAEGPVRSVTGLPGAALGSDEDEDGEDVDVDVDDTAPQKGPYTQQGLTSDALNALRRSRMAGRVKPMSPEEELEARKKLMTQMRAEAGKSPYTEFLEKYNISPEQMEKMNNEDIGVALLEAAQEVIKPGGTVRGLAAGMAALGKSYGAAKQARRREMMATDRMRADILDAERKERMGMSRDVSAALERARKERKDAAAASAQALRHEADVKSRLANALRPPRSAGAGAKTDREDVGVTRIARNLMRENPNMTEVEAFAKATQQYRSLGQQVGAAARSRADADRALQKARLDLENWSKYVKDRFGGDETAAALDYIDRYMEGAAPSFVPRNPLTSPAARPAGSAVPAPPAGFVVNPR